MLKLKANSIFKRIVDYTKKNDNNNKVVLLYIVS